MTMMMMVKNPVPGEMCPGSICWGGGGQMPYTLPSLWTYPSTCTRVRSIRRSVCADGGSFNLGGGVCGLASHRRLWCARRLARSNLRPDRQTDGYFTVSSRLRHRSAHSASTALGTGDAARCSICPAPIRLNCRSNWMSSNSFAQRWTTDGVGHRPRRDLRHPWRGAYEFQPTSSKWRRVYGTEVEFSIIWNQLYIPSRIQVVAVISQHIGSLHITAALFTLSQFICIEATQISPGRFSS